MRLIIVTIGLSAVLFACKVATADSDLDTAEIERLVQSSTVYMSLARGLHAKYECENYQSDHPEEAISVINIRDNADEWEPPILPPEQRAHVNVRVECQGGPSVLAWNSYSNTAWNRLYYPWTLEFDSETIGGNQETCSDLDSSDLEKFVRADPFVGDSWPDVSFEYGSNTVEACDDSHEGQFIYKRMVTKSQFGFSHEFEYVLSCHSKSQIFLRKYLGVCGSADPVVRWVAIETGYGVVDE